MVVQIATHSITVEEFDRMVGAAVFGQEARVELIKGAIIDMSPVGDRHLGCVMLLDSLFQTRLTGRANVLVQSPVRMADDTKPYPDLCLLKWRKDFYTRKSPAYNDVLLVVEVADTSLTYDLETKRPVYAHAGIPIYWVVDLQHEIIHTFQEPVGGEYKTSRIVQKGELLDLPAGLNGPIASDDILG